MGYPSIVKMNVSESLASTPNVLQQTGAIISQGATSLASGSYSLLTAASGLTPLLAPALSISSLAWTSGTVLATTTAAIPGLSVGDTFITTIAGAAPTAFNGTYKTTVTGASTFTYALATNPGTETSPGTYTPPNQGELIAMVDTYFGQGTNNGVYVLELGAGDGTAGPPALTTFINANPGIFYSYLVPRNWDATAALLSLLAGYEAIDSQTYFYITTTSANLSNYTSTMKCVLALVEAPSIPLTEFTLAADFAHNLAYAPTSSNKMTPNAFSYQYGVTAYPSQGNASTLAAILAADASFIGTGAEGGLSQTLIRNGTTADGEDFAWWYSADWLQINTDRAVSAAIINGSNNTLAPLYYNQSGINTLQDTVVEVVKQAIAAGLANGTIIQTALDPATFAANLKAGLYAGMNVVNAVPFPIYTQQNPNDYGNKKYAGLSVVYIPMNGFTQVVINVDVTNLIGSL